MIKINDLAVGTRIKSDTGDLYTVTRMPNNKLRSIGTVRDYDNNPIFVYVRELKSFTLAA